MKEDNQGGEQLRLKTGVVFDFKPSPLPGAYDPPPTAEDAAPPAANKYDECPACQ